MTDRIRISDLRVEFPFATKFVLIDGEELDALIAVAETAHAYHRFLNPLNTEGYSGAAPNFGALTGRLTNTLDRFDFGDDTTTTAGQ